MFKIENLKKVSIQIGLTGGVITYLLINTIPYLINKKLKETEVFEEAMNMMKSHPEAIKYLGEPIEDGRINVTNKELYGSDEQKAWFTVPLKGPKSVGNLYCETSFKKDSKGLTIEKVELSKVELTVKSLPGYKLLIKRSE